MTDLPIDDKNNVIMGAHSMSGANAAKWAEWGATFVSIVLDESPPPELHDAVGEAAEACPASVMGTSA